MHHANHFYGHAHVMARYAGLAEVPRIWGYLQHGWNTLDGFAVNTPLAAGFPKFVFSDAVARRGTAMGQGPYVVTGAPWAYLLHLEQGAAPTVRTGTIVYPFHGWEGQRIVGDHASYAAEIRATEPGPVTICLYWNEFRLPQVRAVYERAGFRVITHGYRGHMWHGTNPAFLLGQLTELRRHRRVVSNRLSSALFYGVSVGAEMGVYGDPMLLAAEDPVFGGIERQRRLWPELHAPAVARDVAREHASVELGLEVRLAPAEVRERFGWATARRAGGAQERSRRSSVGSR